MNYRKLIEGITNEGVIKLMTSLGADRYHETKDAIVFPTICHNIEVANASMKLYFYKDTKLFYCYTEDGPMSIFKFLQTYYSTRQIEYDWYEDIYSVIKNCSSYRENSFQIEQFENYKEKFDIKKIKELPVFPEGVLDTFVKFYPPEWLDDGISKEAMDKFNIRYSISQNKIIIPHYNVNGDLVGVRGRALDEWEIENFGKYMPVKIENTWYNHPLSLNLYGLDKNKENIKKTGVCFLFEAEKSVLQMESFNLLNCSAAVCGSNFNKFQLEILLKECSPQEIIICFDNEEKEKSEDYFNKLYSIGKKYCNYADFSFVYDKRGLSKKKDSPSDNGEEIFRKLIEERIKIR